MLPPIFPPLLNSANPWATTLEDLRALYKCPHTGAVTIRTSLLHGFPHDDAVHQYTFFNPSTHHSTPESSSAPSTSKGSLNTLGYSPIPLSGYLSMVSALSAEAAQQHRTTNPPANPKPIILSITGTVSEVVECHRLIHAHQLQTPIPLAIELNLSCPNIPGKPPPAYSSDRLLEYLLALKRSAAELGAPEIPLGIKVPPYTYADQFSGLIKALSAVAKAEPEGKGCPVSFITAVNTLGSSLLLTPAPSGDSNAGFKPTLNSASGEGIGGLAGAPLHPLALGNVATLVRMLGTREELRGVVVIGVGGVEDAEGFRRMRAVGAAAVGVGTALGRRGVGVFGEILAGEERGKL
ncbi:dihydroorotate dehydrogenase [Coniosporium apollinis]|uniref:Dihydroorotate dehydrogenase n=1 Tax=Coniosporium apollinis TaxID=61459 RepID=A0ABQ9P4X8_9PEZI|nr:dihydroorotate dehydrogenase [Coniosporium apollinis]